MLFGSHRGRTLAFGVGNKEGRFPRVLAVRVEQGGAVGYALAVRRPAGAEAAEVLRLDHRPGPAAGHVEDVECLALVLVDPHEERLAAVGGEATGPIHEAVEVLG